MVGVYRNDVLAEGTAKVTADCSDGLANDYNPNAAEQGASPGSFANWVRVVGDSGCTRDSIVFTKVVENGGPAGKLTFQGNNHLTLDSRCFYIHHLSFGQGGDETRTTFNVRVIGAHVGAIEVRAAKNIEVKDFEGGPTIICAATNSQYSAPQQCDPNGPAFEAPFAARCCPYGAGGGNVDWEGTEIPKVSGNAGGYNPVNIRFHNGWIHDLQTKDADLWHTGCGILQFFRGPGTGGDAGGNHNVILDGIVCERVTVQGFFIEDADGITIQNSVSSCPTEPYNQSTPVGRWGQCAINQRGIDIKAETPGWTPTNILLRYNSIETRLNIGQYSTYSNVRVIGNIYRDQSPCDASRNGVTWAYNVAYGRDTSHSAAERIQFTSAPRHRGSTRPMVTPGRRAP